MSKINEIILDNILQGLTNEEISAKLFYSCGSIKHSLKQLFKTYKVFSRTALAVKVTKINALNYIKSLEDSGVNPADILECLKLSFCTGIKSSDNEYDNRNADIKPRFSVIASEYSKRASNNSENVEIKEE